MQQIQQFLNKIGLNNHESKIYLELLDSGELAASTIASKTNTPRSTTRGILDRLCEQGIVGKIYKQNTQYYHCRPPAALKKHLENKINWAENCLTDYSKIAPIIQGLQTNPSITPKVQYFEGPEQIIEAFNLSLFEPIDEILIFTSYEFLKTPIIQANDDDFYVKERIDRGIKARVLVGKTEASRKLIANCPSELRERRFFPPKYKLPGNIHIYGNFVTYFSASNQEYIAVITESKMMADTMRTLFEFMWERV